MMFAPQPNPQRTYLILLLLLGLGSFGLFSDLELSFWLKSCGLLFFLPAGTVLLYFGVCRKGRRLQRKRSLAQK